MGEELLRQSELYHGLQERLRGERNDQSLRIWSRRMQANMSRIRRIQRENEANDESPELRNSEDESPGLSDREDEVEAEDQEAQEDMELAVPDNEENFEHNEENETDNPRLTNNQSSEDYEPQVRNIAHPFISTTVLEDQFQPFMDQFLIFTHGPFVILADILTPDTSTPLIHRRISVRPFRRATKHDHFPFLQVPTQPPNSFAETEL